MRNDLPISPKKKFKYSISFESFDEESLEAGQSDVRGYEIQDDTDAIGDILMLANTTYGIYMPVSFGTWESTEPVENTDFWERGIRKYYALHLTNEDGTEISQEENDFISFLLSDGRYEIDKFSDYAVGGIVLGSVALGIGALITYFYFKGKKGGKGKKQLVRKTSKSVTYKINGKDRKFPINDAWVKEHSLENQSEDYEVPQEDRFEMGGDAFEYYHEMEYGEGGIARAKEVIMSKIGLNEENADFITAQSEKFAIWLADSIVKANMGVAKELKKQQAVEFLNNNPNILKGLKQRIRGILDWLESPMTPKQNLRELSFIQAEEKAKKWHDELSISGGDIDYNEPKENIILKTYPTNEFGKTYYWVMLPSNTCTLESSRMGHCGQSSYSDNLISFRSTYTNINGEEINDSHITIGYGDGLFYQVKGKQNKKPLEKYFPYIFDFIKSLVKGEIQYSKQGMKFDENNKLTTENVELDFKGFSSEYASSEDYGWEDMTKEELLELYELNPNIFTDFAGKYVLYEAGIINEKPDTTIVIEKSPEYVADLLRLDRNLSDDIIEKILTGETYDLFTGDSWNYYYNNAEDDVEDLNRENYEEVIDKIVEITGLDKAVVKENGAKHYLAGDDEEFDSDNFDDIRRAIASALSYAEENSYVKYYYEEIESALSELGTIKKLNDDGLELQIDLANLMSIGAISSFLKELDTQSLEDVFFEAESQGEIELPKLSIDDRYSAFASTEDFNANFDINNYSKGGSLRPKNINKNKIQNMKPSQSKLAQGGNILSTGISKEDYFLVVQNWVYFTFNYPMGFVKDAFGSSHLTNHLQEKFSSSYTRYGSVGVLMSFWSNLDNKHREMLSLWIKNNYFNSSSKKTQLQSISDENYAKIITHWNMFCFNFSYNFIESVFGDNTSHYEEKWVRAYQSAGSTGAVNKFFTELSGDNQHIFTDWVYKNYDGMKYAKGGGVEDDGGEAKVNNKNEKTMKYANGGNAGDWSASDITNAEYLGIIEFQDNDGEFHNFEVMETDDRLVFGGMTNSGFIESGYIEKDGFSTDETLQSLLEDLEVYYNDGGKYTSQIVFNERMAQGGKVVKKSNKNIRKKRTKKQPKVTRIQFEEGNYEYADGGEVDEFEVYDEETGKTLIIVAHSNEEAEGISETIDFNDYEDGDLINVLDDIANYDSENDDDDNYAGKKDEIIAELKKLKGGLNNEAPEVFVKDNLIYVSAENGDNYADYYELLYIDEKLEALADKYDTYWDWEDAGSIVLTPIDEYAGGGKLGAESKSKIKIIENKKEGKKTATQTLVKENNKGEKITYELSVGMHTTPKENRYADGWFEIYATDENDDEYFYSEGGLWIENGRIYDYDGVYELSEKLKPLLSALNLNSEDVFSEGGEAGELKNVGGNAFYITDTSVENADKNFDSLSDTFFSSKDDFENNMDAIQEFSFNVNVKYQYNIIPAIYEQMAEEGVGNDEGNIQILGFEVDRFPKNNFESELPYDTEDEDEEDDDDYDNDDDNYADGGEAGEEYLVIHTSMNPESFIKKHKLTNYIYEIDENDYQGFNRINFETYPKNQNFLKDESIIEFYYEPIEEYADGGEVEDWMEKALTSLIEETGNEDLEITHIVNSKIKYEFIASDGDVEYRVFQTEGDAEQVAIEQVRDDLEDSPEKFNQDWLMNYIDGRDFFEQELNEMNLSYVEDIASETDSKYANRLIDELVENGLMDEDDAESDNAEEIADEIKYDYIILLTEGQLDEGMDGLQYFIDNFGENETFGMIVDNNLIDIDEASQDAVNVDGIAHFLSSYDGETLYLSDECVAYRTN